MVAGPSLIQQQLPPLAALAQREWCEGTWCFPVRFLLSAQGKFLFFGCVSAKKKKKQKQAGGVGQVNWMKRSTETGQLL